MASADELAPWLSWPQCPICARRRQVRCATCGFAGSDFPLADYQELGAESRLVNSAGSVAFPSHADAETALLLCPQCEEAFLPQFYDHCAACGHEFGDGVHADSFAFDEFTPRVVAAATGVLVLLFALGVYWWAVLSR